MAESTANLPSPDDILDPMDRGDDTQRRFYYQYCCIAIALGALFDPVPDFECFYCEQADDLLGKLVTGKFVAIQIKSKEKGYGPATSKSAEFRSWIAHFCKLESRFPDKFVRYVLMFSNGFLRSTTYDSPDVYKRKISGCDLSKKNSADTKALVQLACDINYSPDTVQAVVKKIEFQDVPELPSIKPVVWKRHFLTLVPNSASMRLDRIFRAFDLFISRIEEACNLGNHDPRQDRLALYTDQQRVQTDSVILGKKVTRDKLQRWLQECTSEVPEFLFTSYNPKPLGDMAAGSSILLKKFTAGMIDLENYQIAVELKGNAEDAFLALRHHLDDPAKAQRVYNSLRVVVRNRCKEAWDEQNAAYPGIAFGTNMLVDVRRRLSEAARTAIPTESINYLMYEHLLGLAYVMTEECLVWWSPKFELGES